VITTTSLGSVDYPILATFGDATLRPGLASHLLTVDVTMVGRWAGAGASVPIILDGFVSVGSQLKPITRIGAHVVTLHDYQVSAPIEALLSDEQLIALESERGAGDVELTFDLSTTLLETPNGVESSITSQTRYRIPSHRWLEQLDNVGAAVGITIRVPSPLTDAASHERSESAEEPSITRAAKRLREARAALRDGNFEGCIASCRFVLENLALLDQPLPAESVRLAVPRSRTQRQRWSAMFHDLYSLASGASHDDELTANFEWTHADAEAVLAATAGLLARVRTL
jgi:hypothetical protein